MDTNRIDVLKAGLEAMRDGSNVANTWSLAVLAGTIAVLISSDYLKPSGPIRLCYLLFLPGWLFLARSIYEADQVTAGYLASVFATNYELLMRIGSNMNVDLSEQRRFFLFSLLFFGSWLLTILVWWVFGKVKKN